MLMHTIMKPCHTRTAMCMVPRMTIMITRTTTRSRQEHDIRIRTCIGRKRTLIRMCPTRTMRTRTELLSL